MVLFILRGAFLLLAVAVSTLYLLTNQDSARLSFEQFVLMLAIVLGVALVVIAIDIGTPRKRLSAVSGVFLGLIAGLLAAYALSIVVDLIGVLTAPEVTTGSNINREEQIARREAYFNLLLGVKVLIGIVTCYIGISLVMQTKDDFRFVIPYVEFAKEVRGQRPLMLDTSAVIDGRVLDIVDTGLIRGTIITPEFVIEELQTLADSADKLKRARGRRGLDVLQKLEDHPQLQTVIDETEVPGHGVDHKLIALAEMQQARIMTNDFNLNKIAGLRHIEVVNMNDLAKAMKPVVLPGETMVVRIVKPGESGEQGVGYLEDGTMVVVEAARAYMQKRVDLTVTSTLQTSAGRMIFGRFNHAAPDPQHPGEPTPAEGDESTSASSSPADGKPEAVTTGGKRSAASRRNPRRG
ncbi:MAG: PIN/TRAM domain-containing protein [Planctomycetota bacterium]